MGKKFFVFRSLKVKVTVLIALLMFFAGALSNLLIYEYSLKSQFEQLRKGLVIIATAISLKVDPAAVLAIPLNEEGVKTAAYKKVENDLLEIKKLAPAIAYIYILRETDKKGIFRFVIDVHSSGKIGHEATAYPGQGYDGWRFPELMKAFKGPAADTKLVADKWGVFLSGYAPILDSNGNAVAILGIDMSASDVYNMQLEVKKRAAFVLVLGVILSLMLGIFISGRITAPIRRLVEGTRHISSGDLDYRVKIEGADEISELASSFNSMAVNLKKARQKLVDYFYGIVQSLIRALEAKDLYTKGHSDRVANYSQKIAFKMGLPEDKVRLLKESALLHDIGKLGVHEMILSKSTDLTEEDWKVVHAHPAIGEDILKPVSPDKELLAAVRGHHERYDGKGYPDRLSGDRIGLLAAIIAVADSYDAMTSHRAYKKDMTKEEAMEQLKRNSGSQFNPKVIDAFIKVLEEER